MIANPLYGPRPDVDAAQLRALRLLPRGEWRGTGCGDRCVRVYAEIMGGGGREVIEAHDPAAHEAYVHELYRPKLVRTGCLTVDIPARRFWVSGEEVRRCGPVRLNFMLALASRVGEVVLKRELWAAIHGVDVAQVHTASYWSATLNHLRHVLGPAADLIETRIDIGYMLRAEDP